MEYTILNTNKYLLDLKSWVTGQIKFLVCVQDGIHRLFFGGKNYRGGTPLNCMSKKLSGETLCKLLPIFPPKDLVF